MPVLCTPREGCWRRNRAPGQCPRRRGCRSGWKTREPTNARGKSEAPTRPGNARSESTRTRVWIGLKRPRAPGPRSRRRSSGALAVLVDTLEKVEIDIVLGRPRAECRVRRCEANPGSARRCLPLESMCPRCLLKLKDFF